MASDAELDALPTVSTTRSVPGSETMGLQSTALLDSHALDTHLVAPPRMPVLRSAPPYPLPTSSNPPEARAAVFVLLVLDSTILSKLVTWDKLPLAPPHVTTTCADPSHR